jgi:hypothetical protein
MKSSELLQAIRERAAVKRTKQELSKGLQLYPPATTETIELAESKLGFKLPTFLKAVYTEVGNGGFGPGYGVVGLPGGFLDDGRDITGLHELLSRPDESEPQWIWPAYLVPICNWGCAIYTCVDAFTDEGVTFTFDPNGHEIGEPIDNLFGRTHDSIESWFLDWVNEVPQWDLMFEEDTARATMITNPFTGEKTQIAPHRLRQR